MFHFGPHPVHSAQNFDKLSGTTVPNIGWRIYYTYKCIILLPTTLTLNEVHVYAVRVFESRQLGRIIGPKRDEVTGGWRKLHNEELPNLYFSSNIITMLNQEELYSGEWCRHGKGKVVTVLK
jgi:hypothetical protein